MTIKQFRFASFLLLTSLGACGADTEEPTPTKQEVAQLLGKADSSDLCHFYGFYGDNECDTFCPQVDPDCSNESPPPAESCSDFCPEIYGPVCGDNGQTYTNSCLATCDDVDNYSNGECSVPPTQGGACCDSPSDACGWIGDGICDEGCAFGQDSDCSDADTNNQPSFDCNQGCPEIYGPVCGTDFVTYSNECEAFCTGGVPPYFSGSCF